MRVSLRFTFGFIPLVALSCLLRAPHLTAQQPTVATPSHWTAELLAARLSASCCGAEGAGALADMRLLRELSEHVRLTLSVGYGEIRHGIDERRSTPQGDVTDVEDYRLNPIMLGLERGDRILGRVETRLGLEAGWIIDGYRVVRWEDPTGVIVPPRDYLDGDPGFGVRAGLRLPLGQRLALSAGVRMLGGVAFFEHGTHILLPELGVRLSF